MLCPPTPLLDGKDSSCIEDFFDEATLSKEIEGKVYDRNDETVDKEKTFGKTVFAYKVVAAEASAIDFSKFKNTFR